MFPDDLDVRLDALALIECAHHDDLDGCRAVLDNCDVRLVCAFLARIGADLVEGLCEDPAEAFQWLRDRHS